MEVVKTGGVICQVILCYYVIVLLWCNYVVMMFDWMKNKKIVFCFYVTIEKIINYIKFSFLHCFCIASILFLLIFQAFYCFVSGIWYPPTIYRPRRGGSSYPLTKFSKYKMFIHPYSFISDAHSSFTFIHITFHSFSFMFIHLHSSTPH